jgi:hypothetical protein
MLPVGNGAGLHKLLPLRALQSLVLLTLYDGPVQEAIGLQTSLTHLHVDTAMDDGEARSMLSQLSQLQQLQLECYRSILPTYMLLASLPSLHTLGVNNPCQMWQMAPLLCCPLTSLTVRWGEYTAEGAAMLVAKPGIKVVRLVGDYVADIEDLDLVGLGQGLGVPEDGAGGGGRG